MKPLPVILHHPLNHPDAYRFALSQRTTDALADSGRYLLAFIGNGDSTVPSELRGRRIVNAYPCDPETLRAVWGVLRGTHRAVKVRKAK